MHHIPAQQEHAYTEKWDKYPLSRIIKLIRKLPDLCFSVFSIDVAFLSSNFPTCRVIKHSQNMLASNLFISSKLIQALILKVFYDRKTRLNFKHYKVGHIIGQCLTSATQGNKSEINQLLVNSSILISCYVSLTEGKRKTKKSCQTASLL